MRIVQLAGGFLVLVLCAGLAQAHLVKEIETKKQLRVCMWPDYFGISYRNPRSGELQGIDISMSQELAKDLGVSLRYVETNFARVIADLESRKCDIAMMGVGVTPDRAARVDFSQPYLRSDVYAVILKSNTSITRWEDLDLPGRVISVQKGTFMEPLMQRTLKNAELRIAQRTAERERDVESGRADAFITDYPYSRRMLANTDWANVIAPSQPIAPIDYAYAVPKGEEVWIARINEFLSKTKTDGRLEKYARQFDLLPILVRD